MCFQPLISPFASATISLLRLFLFLPHISYGHLSLVKGIMFGQSSLEFFVLVVVLMCWTTKEGISAHPMLGCWTRTANTFEMF